MVCGHQKLHSGSPFIQTVICSSHYFRIDFKMNRRNKLKHLVGKHFKEILSASAKLSNTSFDEEQNNRLTSTQKKNFKTATYNVICNSILSEYT